MTWTKTWPTEPGEYLFYGDWHPRMNMPKNPRFFLVRVRRSSNGISYVGDGRFFYSKEMLGVFKRFDESVPEGWEAQ